MEAAPGLSGARRWMTGARAPRAREVLFGGLAAGLP